MFSGGMAFGSLAWGGVAQRWGSAAALLAAAAGTVFAAAIGLRFRLGVAAGMDAMPSGHWPQPLVIDIVDTDRGPVLVTIEYRVAPEHRDEFLRMMRRLGRSRRRDGAVQWGVMEDTAQPDVWLEYFVVGSWLEHLRQHERVTQDERRLQESILALLSPGAEPRVRHFLGGAPGPAIPDLPNDQADA